MSNKRCQICDRELPIIKHNRQVYCDKSLRDCWKVAAKTQNRIYRQRKAQLRPKANTKILDVKIEKVVKKKIVEPKAIKVKKKIAKKVVKKVTKKKITPEVYKRRKEKTYDINPMFLVRGLK